MPRKEENKTGRPSKLSETIVGKLEVGFARGYNIAEACKYAGINRSTYYDWIEANEEFSFARVSSLSSTTLGLLL